MPEWVTLQLLDGSFLYVTACGHTYRRDPDPALEPDPPRDAGDDELDAWHADVADDVPPF